jgi:hypothetical protein
MAIVLRYACLLGIGLASLFVFLSAGSLAGRMMAEGGTAAAGPDAMTPWMLGVIAAAGLFSVLRFFIRMPIALRDWYHANKDRIATLTLVGIVGLVFVVF